MYSWLFAHEDNCNIEQYFVWNRHYDNKLKYCCVSTPLCGSPDETTALLKDSIGNCYICHENSVNFISKEN
jgi:hypothetical protein